MNLELHGLTAIVTGASQGIGKAIAIGMARHGAEVALVARTASTLETVAAEIRQEAGKDARVLTVPTDVRQADEVAALVETVHAELRAVDILVNNAGTSQRGPFLEQTDERWQDDLDLKVFAAIRLARRTIPDMQAAGRGRIINITAIVGKHATAESMPTSVSRAAGIAMTKALSKEFAADGILVNSICIGTIESGQQDRRWQQNAPELSREEFYRFLAADRGLPMGRVGLPEEVANLAVFLASDASSYLSGTAINLDGGASHVV